MDKERGKYNVLFINKDFGTQNPSRADANEIIEEYLKNGGHNYLITRSVSNVSPVDYAGFDCVLAHVPSEELKKLESLAKTFPEVGLIMTTGDGVGPQYQELCRDTLGRFFLAKPFHSHTLQEAMRIVVFEAKNTRNHLK